jgi:hypothetical protein
MAKQPSPTIDPKVLQVDVLALFKGNKRAGLTAADVGGLLINHENYVTYPHDYVMEWAASMLDKLTGRGLVVRKGDRYFPGKSAVAG